jgi:hypothetical protein
VPVLANVKTTGRYPVEYFWYAGRCENEVADHAMTLFLGAAICRRADYLVIQAPLTKEPAKQPDWTPANPLAAGPRLTANEELRNRTTDGFEEDHGVCARGADCRGNHANAPPPREVIPPGGCRRHRGG